MVPSVKYEDRNEILERFDQFFERDNFGQNYDSTRASNPSCELTSQLDVLLMKCSPSLDKAFCRIFR
jgi:hypothetical protein